LATRSEQVEGGKKKKKKDQQGRGVIHNINNPQSGKLGRKAVKSGRLRGEERQGIAKTKKKETVWKKRGRRGKERPFYLLLWG